MANVGSNYIIGSVCIRSHLAVGRATGRDKREVCLLYSEVDDLSD